MVLNLVCRLLVRNIRVSYSSPIVLQNVRFSPFSSEASKSISETGINDSFTTNYLIDTFGFSQQKAFSTSKYMKISSTDRAQTVIAFLTNRGFTSDQIGSIVRRFPQIIWYDPHKVFVRKIEFFVSSGIPEAEVNNIILGEPTILSRSLENHIIPSFSYIKKLFNSNDTSLSFTQRGASIFNCDLESTLMPNIEILRNAGVPDSRIMMLMQNQPKTFLAETEKFKEVVEEVKKMNFDTQGVLFIEAVRVIRGMKKMTWDKKMAAYKEWGFSENDVILAFQKHPSFMALSTDKMMKIMDFLVSEVGLDCSFVVKRPLTMSHSLEKRIKPRYSVFKYLLKNGLIIKGSCLSTMFGITEANFLKKFVLHYEREAPELLQLYQKELAVSTT